MRNRSLLFLGLVLIVLGLLSLFSELLHIDFWTICWPVGLILIGVWMLARPRLLPANVNLEMRLLGDVKRRGVWQVQDEEFWSLVGDTKLDLSEAEIPTGETHWRVYGMVGTVHLRLPPEVGVSIISTAFLSTTRILGEKQDTFVAPYEYTSPGYASAERKIRLESWFFVADIRVSHTTTEPAS